MLQLLTAVEQVVEPMSDNKRQIDGSEVLSALGVLLSNQLTCKRCTATDNRPQSSYPAPPTGQKPNRNVPPAASDNTTPATLANNVELTPVNNTGELLRYVLRDVRKLKTAITRQRATHDDTAKRHQADVEEVHRQKKERRNRRGTSLSDDDDDDNDDNNDDDGHYQLSKERQSRYNANLLRYPTMTRDSRVSGDVRVNCDDGHINADRTERRRHLYDERLYDNLEPLTTRRSSRWNESADDDVDGRYYDHSLPTSSTLWRNRFQNYHPSPPEQYTTSLGSAHQHVHGSLEPRQTAAQYPPSQHHPHQQQNQPVHMQRQFYQQQMQTYPHQTPQQPQPGAFRPIHQMAPAHQPLIFVPIHQHHHQPHCHKQQQQQREQFRAISFHSPDVSTRANKQQPVRSRARWLTNAVKLANETKNLTAHIQKRQKQVVTTQRLR